MLHGRVGEISTSFPFAIFMLTVNLMISRREDISWTDLLQWCHPVTAPHWNSASSLQRPILLLMFLKAGHTVQCVTVKHSDSKIRRRGHMVCFCSSFIGYNDTLVTPLVCPQWRCFIGVFSFMSTTWVLICKLVSTLVSLTCPCCMGGHFRTPIPPSLLTRWLKSQHLHLSFICRLWVSLENAVFRLSVPLLPPVPSPCRPVIIWVQTAVLESEQICASCASSQQSSSLQISNSATTSLLRAYATSYFVVTRYRIPTLVSSRLQLHL